MQIKINEPKLWLDKFPLAKDYQNKYDRGFAVIAGGNESCTGAARLAAISALRSGAGLVTIACPISALEIYAKSLLSVMTKPYSEIDEFDKIYSDKRITAALIGPGTGVNSLTKDKTEKILEKQIPTVLDADSLTVFKDNPDYLFSLIKSEVVMAPHEGEFKRIFDIEGSREVKALKAAKISNSSIILKGHHTIIADPKGNIVQNINAPASLATAGSGDVLAGIITGLMAQKVNSFDAACIGVYIHSEIGNILGNGMISEDMPEKIGQIIKSIKNQ